MKSLIACKVNTFSRDKQEKILLYVYAFRSNMSKSVLSLAMAYIVSFPFIDISYSLLFDSVLLFIRFQIFLIFSFVFVKCCKTRLVYCLKETF